MLVIKVTDDKQVRAPFLLSTFPTDSVKAGKRGLTLPLPRSIRGVQTLTFKTRSSVYLNRFDSLNRQLLRRYANKQRATATSLPLISEQQATATATAGGMQADEPEVADAASAAAGDSGAAAGGAASKKKKSKGKKKANK